MIRCIFPPSTRRMAAVSPFIRLYAKKAKPTDQKTWEWSSEQMESNMDKVIQHLSGEYAQLQIGRATPALVSGIFVHGTRLDSVAQISIQDPHTLVAVVPDAEKCKAVESAIRSANLNLNPVPVDKNTIKIPIPRPSKESRQVAAKQVQSHSEARKTAIRHLRQTELKRIQKMDVSSMSSCDKKSLTQEVDKICKTYVDKCDTLAKHKVKEILG